MYVRSDQFLIARATVRCTRCAVPTEVIGLALPPGHETDEFDESDDVDARRWTPAHHHALLFWVDSVSPGVGSWLQTSARHYKASVEDGSTRLENHCEHCGARLDDQDLFCEPGGPFMPTDATEAKRISLQRVDQPIEATADGYAHEPEFFASVTRL